ncbi:MAG: hypothetical protein OXE44_16730 [Nitrospinae bacterium]|nr:hypothetical protein [Nitrospinota bacterium]
MATDELTIHHEDLRGRILSADSMTYFDERVEERDVLIGGSYAARMTMAWAMRLGARAIVAHAAGVGKDDAGISGLRLAQEYNVPALACETMSARLAVGVSVYEGEVGHANQVAQSLGVEIGQSIAEASKILLDADVGREVIVEESLDDRIYELEHLPDGNIRASWGIPVLRSIQEPRPQDVFIQASHCGLTLVPHVMKLNLKGVIANDAGRGKDDSGIASFPYLAREGIAVAAVGAMSARIGDVMSTWQEGVISCMNEVAEKRGVREGMMTREAAIAMLNA